MTAVIDIGSNSVRMMLAGETTEKFIRITRLAKGLSLNGRLSPTAIKRTTRVVKGFCRRALRQRVDHIFVFATEAVRSSANGGELVEEIRLATGLRVDVVSGQREAELGFLGAIGEGEGGIIDVGGASTEVTTGRDGEISYARSCPVGAVRLVDQFGQDEDAMSDHLDVVLEFEPQSFSFVAIGGTASTLAAMKLKLKEFSHEAIEGCELTIEDLTYFKDLLFATPVSKRKFAGLHPARREVIAAGTLILLRTMLLLGVDSVRVTAKDNLEGYII